MAWIDRGNENSEYRLRIVNIHRFQPYVFETNWFSPALRESMISCVIENESYLIFQPCYELTFIALYWFDNSGQSQVSRPWLVVVNSKLVNVGVMISHSDNSKKLRLLTWRGFASDSHYRDHHAVSRVETTWFFIANGIWQHCVFYISLLRGLLCFDFCFVLFFCLFCFFVFQSYFDSRQCIILGKKDICSICASLFLHFFVWAFN